MQVRLQDICDVKWGDTSITKASYVSEGYPAFSASGYDGFLPHFDYEGLGIVVSAIGAKCGKTWLADGKWSCIKNTIVIKSRSDEVDTRFIFFATLDPTLWPRRGAAQPFIALTDAKNVVIDLPPLATQRQIVALLSAHDDLIENDFRRVRILEGMARALYDEWFVDFRFPGHESVPFVATSIGVTPQGWAGCLGDLVVIERVAVNPYQFPREEFQHFSIPAFDEGKIPRVEAGETILSSKYAINASCVLLSKLNPHIPRVWLPIPDEQRRAIASTEFLVLKPKAGVSRELIYAKCNSEEFSAQFGTLALGTSTSHQRVKPNDLLKMPTTTPDEAMIRRFSSLVGPMLELSQRLRTHSATLGRTRDLLRPRLLSGQLSVNEGA